MVKDLSYFHLPKINSSTLYSILKRFIKVFIPKELLRQTEPFLRNIYSIFYFGNKVECAVCGNHHSKFIVLKNGDKLKAIRFNRYGGGSWSSIKRNKESKEQEIANIVATELN